LGILAKPFTASQLTQRNLVCDFPAIALEDWCRSKQHLPELNWSQQHGQYGETAALLLPSELADRIEPCD
jgi:hypothetical protein